MPLNFRQKFQRIHCIGNRLPIGQLKAIDIDLWEILLYLAEPAVFLHQVLIIPIRFDTNKNFPRDNVSIVVTDTRQIFLRVRYLAS